MMNCTLICRTVAIQKEYREYKKNGKDVKEISMRVAVPRMYSVTDESGNKNVATDFILVTARGNAAERLNDYCTDKDENGKLISRQLCLTGAFETYKSNVHVTDTIRVKLKGKVYDIPYEGDHEWTSFIFWLRDVQFLDSKGSGEKKKSSKGKQEVVDLDDALEVDDNEEGIPEIDDSEDSNDIPEVLTGAEDTEDEDEIPIPKVADDFEDNDSAPFS